MNDKGLLRLMLVLPLVAQPVLANEQTPSSGTDAARDALSQKSDDVSSEKNLQQVFQSSEKNYSLLKAGKVGMNYSVDYSYYRNSRIDIAISGSSSSITRFRIEEDAQHTFTNTIDLSYGVWDNLTFNTSLPLVAKYDTQSDLSATALGDIAFGVRWQPIPLKRGLPTTTIFSTFSTATGDSPYKTNVLKDLSTGKGYYSLSAGASMSKVTDPIVLFASGSFVTGNNIGGLNQARGNRILRGVEPGDSLGFSMGMAYALNYDVSVTASFQHSYGMSTRFKFFNPGNNKNEEVNTADQVSSSLNFSLGLRTSPKRIVNLSLGFGLTEDASDVSLGFSMPIDFAGAR